MQLLDLNPPEVIEVFDFESIKARKLGRVLELMQEKGIEYVPSESDDIMTMIEADAYEEMFRNTRINNVVKGQLLAFAKDADLEHIGATRHGVLRLEGSKPYASFTFSLSTALNRDITLTKGLQLGDGKGTTSVLLNDVVIASGQMSATAIVELQQFVASSEIKTETILTPLAYVLGVTQDAPFHDGSSVEDDDRYRERIWLSRDRKSTAGATSTYKYYAKSADARIVDVEIVGRAGVVKVYLLSKDGAADDIMIDRVNASLNAKKIRPLTDDVQVLSAEVIELDIIADVTLYDLTYEAGVRALIDEALAENTMIFSKSLSIAKLYGLLDSEQVKDVTIIAPDTSMVLERHQVIHVRSVVLNITEAL